MIEKKALELFTFTPPALRLHEWQHILATNDCRYIDKKCDKTRKSQPEIAIGTCIVGYAGNPVIICPHRFLQHRQIFQDVVPLLDHHQPSNQIHVIPEITLPGGSVDYFIVSVQADTIVDYLALEIQALDTTGSVWFSRQKMIREEIGIPVEIPTNDSSYGINWKMTAKTILIQMHHKVETLELLGKKLVLVIQDVFFNYMQTEFSTQSLQEANRGNSAHFHIYTLNENFVLQLMAQHSTTATGIERMLGRQKAADIPEEVLLQRLQLKMGKNTLLESD